MLSIIIPTFNENSTNYLEKILKSYQKIKDIEIICVDGGSQDQTCATIQKSSAKLIQTDILSRAGRLNEGIKIAQNNMILLHHPRSLVSVEGINYLNKKQKSLTWGAFTHRFDTPHPLLSFTSWYSNQVRGDLKKIYYLDHCLFAQKELLQKVQSFPLIDIFEDTEICLKLSKESTPTRLPFISETSAVRFKKNGFFKQALLNQYMKLAYYLKTPHTKMNKLYEKNTSLNSKYEQ